MALKTIDPQISGIQDDGTPEGVIRAKLVSGELIKVRANTTLYVASGNVTVSNNYFSNPDGSNTLLGMNTSAGFGTNPSQVKAQVFGRTIGVRFRRNASTPAFSVVIDGVPYDIPKNTRQGMYHNQTAGIDEYEANIIVATDLDDTIPHTVQVILPPIEGSNQTLVFFGFLAEAKAGYSRPPSYDQPSTGSLTTSLVRIPRLANVFALRKIFYHNTDASARVVTLQFHNGSSSVIVWSKTVAPGTTEICELAPNGVSLTMSTDTTRWEHRADGTGVVFTTITTGN